MPTDVELPPLIDNPRQTERLLARLEDHLPSPAKAAAALINGTKGGRPRKSARS